MNCETLKYNSCPLDFKRKRTKIQAKAKFYFNHYFLTVRHVLKSINNTSLKEHTNYHDRSTDHREHNDKFPPKMLFSQALIKIEQLNLLGDIVSCKFNFFSIDQVSLCCLVNNVSCKTKR